MKLYFFRHGHAEDADGPDFDDFARRLTEKGIAHTQAAARVLRKLAVKPVRLYSSPRIRARQTADILANVLGIKVDIREEIGFGFNPEHIEPLIANVGADDEVIFVGHEPDLSIAVSNLIDGGDIVMKKGGMARVDVVSRAPLRGSLVWLIQPKVFNALAD